MADITTGALTPTLTIAEHTIHQIDGLYSLNDLHKASGGEAKNKPGNWLMLEQTKALIEEILIAGIPAIKTQRGKFGGTYACKELVIAYAAWISPAFNLKVIRVFLAVTTAASENHDAKQKAIPARIPVRKVGDLSFFCKSGLPHIGKGSVSEWWDYPQHLKNLPWEEGMKVGHDFFAEIAELAAHDEYSAYIALSAVLGISWSLPVGNPERNDSIEYGFAQAITMAAITGLRAVRNGAVAYAYTLGGGNPDC